MVDGLACLSLEGVQSIFHSFLGELVTLIIGFLLWACMMHGLHDLRFLFVENWLIPQDNGYWISVRSGYVVNRKVAEDVGVFTKAP